MRTVATSEAGLVELAGDDPRWIWAFTCATPGCDCRTAVVLSTEGDRQGLVVRGAPVRDAWLRGDSHAKAAATLEGVTAFAIDIDEGGVFPAYDEDPLAASDFDAHPEVRRVADRIDGDTLEELGRLWYRGKGWQGWLGGARRWWASERTFSLRHRVFEAVNLYCVPGLLLRRGGARLRADRPGERQAPDS